MTLQALSSRAVIGEYYLRLEQDEGRSWIDAVSMEIRSNQEIESYRWLGMTPAMREWVGGRQAKGLRSEGIDVRNLPYESTLEFDVDELRRDKTGQAMIRIAEHADRARAHWMTLLSTLIVNGESDACYDGQFFFDTDHSEGDSGSQDNDITVDISALPTGDTTGTHGSTADPSLGEMSLSIQAGIQQIIGFVDDQGEPMNEMASEFLVMVPTTLVKAATGAATRQVIAQGMDNPLAQQTDYRVRVAGNARLNSSWTDRFVVFRTDGVVKPLIRQNEVDLQVAAIAEGSELEFNDRKHRFGMYASRAVAYGFWQGATLVTMT